MSAKIPLDKYLEKVAETLFKIANSTRVPPMTADQKADQEYLQNMTGIMSRWSKVGNGFAICSIVCCVIVLLSSLALVVKKRALLERPSFRITMAIALSDLVNSICQLLQYQDGIMKRATERQLRLLIWFNSATTFSFVLLSTCVGVQIMLTVLLNKPFIANRVQRWYELVSFLVAFIATHPILYIYKKVEWITQIQVMHVVSERSYQNMTAWLMEWAWVLLCIVYLFVIVVLTYLRLSNVWRSTANGGGLTAPERLDLLNNQPSHNKSYLNAQRIKYVRWVTLRLACYPIVPILTQTWPAAANMLTRAPYWLNVVANVVPSLQGTINLLLFLMNPAFDVYRRKFVGLFQRSSQFAEEHYRPLDGSQSSSANGRTLVENGSNSGWSKKQ
ncbi:hypothetical protein GGI12_004757 [Dipsacomyces acuminosporus]|nr:hypothetical protein GGI12_004757 [Dipsacomyces acuminosporus]